MTEGQQKGNKKKIKHLILNRKRIIDHQPMEETSCNHYSTR